MLASSTDILLKSSFLSLPIFAFWVRKASTASSVARPIPEPPDSSSGPLGLLLRCPYWCGGWTLGDGGFDECRQHCLSPGQHPGSMSQQL
jgi:hypothetical protein